MPTENQGSEPQQTQTSGTLDNEPGFQWNPGWCTPRGQWPFKNLRTQNLPSPWALQRRGSQSPRLHQTHPGTEPGGSAWELNPGDATEGSWRCSGLWNWWAAPNADISAALRHHKIQKGLAFLSVLEHRGRIDIYFAKMFVGDHWVCCTVTISLLSPQNLDLISFSCPHKDFSLFCFFSLVEPHLSFSLFQSSSSQIWAASRHLYEVFGRLLYIHIYT